MKNHETDQDILAYEKLVRDPEWFERYKGLFAVFILGSFIDAYPTFEVAVNTTRAKYLNKPAFIQEVGNDSVIDTGDALVPGD